MKPITDKLKSKLKYGRKSETIHWNDIYDTEDELVTDMFKVNTDEDNVPHYKICKGYEYIKSFRKYYTSNRTLTEKQMAQLKRLAAEIAYHIYAE